MAANIEVKKLGGPLGAEVRGFDPCGPLDAASVKAINDAFLDHLVLRFRDMPMTTVQLRDFSARFGILRPHVAKNYRDAAVPEVVIMTNQDAQGNYDKVGAERGVGWHVDGTYLQESPKATMLHAVALPDSGGNTAFANMYMAYETLPEALKRRAEGKVAVHRLRGRKHHTQGIVGGDDLQKMGTVVHPVIRPHPETGRKALFINPHHTLNIVGLSQRDSDEFIDEVCAWSARPEFQWEQQWQVGDTILWENRCAWHSGRDDYPKNQLRKFYRTSLFELGANAAVVG